MGGEKLEKKTLTSDKKVQRKDTKDALRFETQLSSFFLANCQDFGEHGSSTEKTEQECNREKSYLQ